MAMTNNYIDHYTTATSTPTTYDVYSYRGLSYDHPYGVYNDFDRAVNKLSNIAKGYKKSFNAELQDEIDEWLNIFN